MVRLCPVLQNNFYRNAFDRQGICCLALSFGEHAKINSRKAHAALFCALQAACIEQFLREKGIDGKVQRFCDSGGSCMERVILIPTGIIRNGYGIAIFPDPEPALVQGKLFGGKIRSYALIRIGFLCGFLHSFLCGFLCRFLFGFL